ncbi:MAG: hypothetical protein BACD_03526 [Bacteroides rodentium]
MNKKIFGKVIGGLVVLFCFSFTASRPKLFVIGDSISIFYGPYLKKYVEGSFDYDRKRDEGEAMTNLDVPVGANGGDSRMVVDYMKQLAADASFKADVLLVNCGLHDVKSNPQTGKKQIDLDEYRCNLDTIYRLVQQMNTRLVWVNCTPINDSVHNSKRIGFFRYDKDVVRYNEVADSVFRQKGVPVIDLYGFSSKFSKEAYMDHVHYDVEYRKLQAAYIAGYLENLLTKE